MGAPRLSAALLLAVLPASTHVQGEEPQLTLTVAAMRGTRGDCNWPAVIEWARRVKERAPRGSDPWFEACRNEVHALYELWEEPAALERTARDALEVAADARRADSFSTRSALGPLHPITAGYVADVQEHLARLLQSRGQHAEALGLLRLLMDDLARGPIDDAAGRMARAGLDAAGSLIVLGRGLDACAALGSLRDSFRDTRQGAVANALLQFWTNDLGAYRGEHQGDEEHVQRMRAALTRVPAARKRLAARLGWPEDGVLPFPVGFSDAVPGVVAFAVTEGDPRRPNIAPVVVVSCETLAFGRDLEQILVHELSHAMLLLTCGPPYGRFPFWLLEGISEGLADQIELNVELHTSVRLVRDPQVFVGGGRGDIERLTFDSPPCAASAADTSLGLSFLLLMEDHGLEGLRALIGALGRRLSPDEALRQVTGMGEREYLAAALDHARDVLERSRRTVAEAVRPLVQAQASGPEAVLEEAERLLSAPVPEVARGYALWQRASALEGLGRYGEALEAVTGLSRSSPVHSCYTEFELMARARCLIHLGRKDEARSLLAAIRRDAFTPDVARWAEEQARALDAPGSK